MSRRRGLALVEVLITLALTAGLIFVVSSSFEAATNLERRIGDAQQASAEERAFRQTFVSKLESARLSTNPASTASFFLAGAVALGGDGLTSNSITFTADSNPQEALVNAEGDFETLNQEFGPQGGLAEYSFSMTPIGNANGKTGLFLRSQIPADGDVTQGGFEQLISDKIQSINFEFWDGLQWVGAWDTSTQNPKRLPAAVRVHYTLTTDSQENTMTIRLKHSDVTQQNPVSTGGGT